LLFKALKILFVVRVIEDNNIVNVEEEHNPVVYLKVQKALNRV
jgi:ribosome-binding ATPase YchF (GTP1/OBG family)